VSDGAAQSVPNWRCADQAKDAGVACCLTFAAPRDRVPLRCGMPPPPTPSQGRAGAMLNSCAQRLLRKAQRALAVALSGVGELAGPHGRHSRAKPIDEAIIHDDFVRFALLT